MASEPNIVEIYVDPTTKGILEYCPASGMVGDGEDLPEDAIFITQININDVIADVGSKTVMVCPYECKDEDCDHFGEHEANSLCDKNCSIYGAEGGCHVAEFTPVDDIGDEEEIG